MCSTPGPFKTDPRGLGFRGLEFRGLGVYLGHYSTEMGSKSVLIPCYTAMYRRSMRTRSFEWELRHLAPLAPPPPTANNQATKKNNHQLPTSSNQQPRAPCTSCKLLTTNATIMYAVALIIGIGFGGFLSVSIV